MDYIERPDRVNGAGPSRPVIRRKVTGEVPQPSGLPTNVVPTGQTRGGILSPLNPKRGVSSGGLLGFGQQTQARPTSPSGQLPVQMRQKRTLGLGKNG